MNFGKGRALFWGKHDFLFFDNLENVFAIRNDSLGKSFDIGEEVDRSPFQYALEVLILYNVPR